MKLAILGDFIIDEFLEYRSKRLSPESPCPVVNLEKNKIVAGGAANVANSCHNIGIDIIYIYAHDQNNSNNYESLLLDYEKMPFKRDDFRFSIKKRHCIDNIQFFREDSEVNSKDLEISLSVFDRIIDLLIKRKIKYLLISDYQKGTIKQEELKYLLNLCFQNNIKTFLDTKINNPTYIEKCFLYKPNLKEFSEITGFPNNYDVNLDIKKAIEPYAKRLIKNHKIENCVITLSEKGSLWITENSCDYFKSKPILVKDIVGAGDTFISIIAYCYMKNLNYTNHQKLKLATLLAEKTISESGTNSISKDSLNKSLRLLNKKDIGFTNGCFDILHPGHISLLEQAKGRCKKLIVGLNSDNSVRSLKGETRPINSELDRKKVLESINCVDEVIIFEEQTPLELIKRIKPDILIKGADYKIEDVAGRSFVESYGGTVYLAELLDTSSTTKRISKINKKT